MPAFRKTAETFTSGAKTLPLSYLVSQEVFAKEQERVFSTQWLCVGHQSQIAKAGDYFVQEVAGESLIILRDQKAEVRAFYNVCHDFHPDDAVEFWDMTNRQDWHVCELSQQGIASRAYRPGPYSPRESIPAAWDRAYLRALGERGS